MNNHLTKTERSLFRAFLDLFVPPVCLHCETILTAAPDYLSLCEACRQKLIPMPPEFPEENIRDRLRRTFIDQIYVAYQYTEVIQSVIHHIKYRKMPNLGIRIGELTALTLQSFFSKSTERNLVPVPLHPVRQKERGYNQSRFISEGIIRIESRDLLENILIRKKNTLSQTKLSRQEREENIHEAFHIVEAARVTGKPFILVDDLITTGATINECARLLKENGAAEVIGVAVASPMDLHNPSGKG